ncbi:unnamed protein product [Lactuca virosa]|uniref:Uncharacterized protein n=1 Tax=Lactuca virosa TaxID=75947 RepID=A0AAU9P376_9ASTR|nr:unnamed protein product [Lactuca virosa]
MRKLFPREALLPPPPPEHDVASVKLAKLLGFQDSIPQSRGKGISIGSGHIGDEDSQQTIFELIQEIVLLKQISDLQASLGGLTSLYFDLKDKLIGKFGDEFKTSGSDDGRASDSSERFVVSPIPDANIE